MVGRSPDQHSRRCREAPRRRERHRPLGANAHCKTVDNGHCSFPTKSFSKEHPSVTFTVTKVGRASFSYAPADKHDADHDSDGSAITIVHP
jgi:hypothetical protein